MATRERIQELKNNKVYHHLGGNDAVKSKKEPQNRSYRAHFGGGAEALIAFLGNVAHMRQVIQM
jgi:hypothetical protein